MSWKKYGGIKQLGKANNLNVNSLITDTLTLRSNYDGNFQVNGILFVNPDIEDATSTIKGNLDVSGNLEVGGDVTFQGDMRPNYVFISDLLDVSGVTKIGNTMFMEDSEQAGFLKGSNGNIGINNATPEYLLDVSGGEEKLVRFVSNRDNVKNTMIENENAYGIVFQTDNTKNAIQFFHSDTTNDGINSGSFSITHLPSGTVTHDVSQNIHLQTKKVFVKDNDAINTLDESTFVIHNSEDVSLNYFLSHVDVSNNTTTGVALKLVGYDNSSNAFMKAVNSENKGWNYGGGVHPFDTTRSMGSMGWTDICNTNYVFSDDRYVVSQSMVSGNSLVKNRSSTGFNTFQPKVDDYVVDINGPLKVNHNEIHETAVLPFKLKNISFSKSDSFGLASGRFFKSTTESSVTYDYYFMYSRDYGKTWKTVMKPSGSNVDFDCFANDLSLSVIHGLDNFYYFQDVSSDFINNTDNEQTTNIAKRFIINYDTNTYRVFVFTDGTATGTHKRYTVDISFNDNQNISKVASGFTVGDHSADISFNSIQSIDGKRDSNGETEYLYLAGNDNDLSGAIYKIEHTGGSATINNPLLYTNPNISTYKSIKYFDNGSVKHVLAVGGNYITRSSEPNVSASYTNETIGSSNNVVSLNDVFIYDASNAIVVGDEAKIFYSNNYLNHEWHELSSSMINSMGNELSLFDTSIDIVTVHMIDDSSTFIFGCVLSDNQSKIFHCHFPGLFHKESKPSLLDVSGNVNFSGVCNVSKLTIDGNDGLTLSYIDSSYKNSNSENITLSKSIVIGDENTRIDVRGYLNLLDVSGTNIEGVSSGDNGGGGGDNTGLSESQVVAKIQETTSLPNLTTLDEFKETNIERTSSKFFFVNYDGLYQSRQTAGSGLYIYNDISSDQGISVDQQLDDGYIRISKYKVDSIAPQDSFSFKSTGNESRVRLNLKKLRNSVSASDKKPLIFLNYLSISGDLPDNQYDDAVNYENDHVEIDSSASSVYVDSSGNLYTSNNNFFTHDISLSGFLYAHDGSFNGNVYVDQNLDVSGNLTVHDISLTGFLYAHDGSFNGNVYIDQNLDLSGNLTVHDISLTGFLYAHDGSFNGNVYVDQNLDVSGNLDVYNLKIENNLEVNSVVFTATEVENVLSSGGGFNGGDLSANNGDFSGNLFITDSLSFNGDLFVSGSQIVSSKVINSLNGTFTGDVNITGNLVADGNIDFSFNDSRFVVGKDISNTDGFLNADGYLGGASANTCGIVVGKGSDNTKPFVSASKTLDGAPADGLYLSSGPYDYTGHTTGVIIMPTTVQVNTSMSAVSFNSTSDYRVKNNIENLSVNESSFDNIRPVKYVLNKTNETQYGFIAHELQELYPEVVNGIKDGEEIQTINYIGLIPVMVREIQDLRKRLSILESRL